MEQTERTTQQQQNVGICSYVYWISARRRTVSRSVSDIYSVPSWFMTTFLLCSPIKQSLLWFITSVNKYQTNRSCWTQLERRMLGGVYQTNSQEMHTNYCFTHHPINIAFTWLFSFRVQMNFCLQYEILYYILNTMK